MHRYTDRYGWVATSVDWRFWYQEAQRVANADARRMDWWSSGAEGAVPEHARTGYRLLDMRVPPTVLGRAMRKFGLRVSNRTAHWEEDERRRRVLQSTVWKPNPLDSGRKLRDMLYDPQSWASVDPTTDGLVRFLESRDHRTRARRLSEYGVQQAENYAQGVATAAKSAAGVAGSFFESPIRAPTYQNPLAAKSMGSPGTNPVSTYETIARYALFSKSATTRTLHTRGHTHHATLTDTHGTIPTIQTLMEERLTVLGFLLPIAQTSCRRSNIVSCQRCSCDHTMLLRCDVLFLHFPHFCMCKIMLVAYIAVCHT